MILKYYDCGTNEWKFRDKCSDVAIRPINHDEMIKRYDEVYPDKSGYDPASEAPVENKDILRANKVFWFSVSAEHGINAIEPTNMDEKGTYRVSFRCAGGEWALVSNMTVYLLNDDGKTIEKLI